MKTSLVLLLFLALTASSLPIDNDVEKTLCREAFLTASMDNLPSAAMCIRFMEDQIFPHWHIHPKSQKFTTLGEYCCTYKCKVAHFHDITCRHGI